MPSQKPWMNAASDSWPDRPTARSQRRYRDVSLVAAIRTVGRDLGKVRREVTRPVTGRLDQRVGGRAIRLGRPASGCCQDPPCSLGQLRIWRISPRAFTFPSGVGCRPTHPGAKALGGRRFALAPTRRDEGYDADRRALGSPPARLERWCQRLRHHRN